VLHLGNGIVEIKTNHGHFIAVGHHGRVYLSDYHHDYDTRFHMEFHGNSVAFRTTNHGRYLGVDWSGNVRGHHTITTEEEFQEIPVLY